VLSFRNMFFRMLDDGQSPEQSNPKDFLNSVVGVGYPLLFDKV
jgi:hypothetical protein